MGKSQQTPVSAQDVKDVLSQAQLDQKATDIIVANLNASAAALAACQGADATKLGATEATIVTYLVDASGSMFEVEKEVQESLAEVVVSMVESKLAAALTLSLISFNERVWVSFANKPVEEIASADIQYRADGFTALYDATLDALTGALAYEELLLRVGMSTKVIVVVFSDGADNRSHRVTAAKINKVVRDLLATRRESWILAFVGFKTYEAGKGIDYQQIAHAMGFSALLVVDLQEPDVYKRRHAIRQVFRLTSKSVIRQSQTAIDPNAPAADFFGTT